MINMRREEQELITDSWQNRERVLVTETLDTHTHTLRHFSNTEIKSQVFKFFKNHDNTNDLIKVEQKNS